MLIFLLKLIGIILLSILGFVLVLLLLVLFAPVRYCAEAEYDKKTLRISARVSWLWIFRVYVDFMQNSLSYKVKVLFFHVINSEKQDKKKDKDKEKDKEKDKDWNNGQEKHVKKTEPEDVAGAEETPQEAEKLKEAEKLQAAGNADTSPETKAEKKKKFRLHFMHPAEIYDIIITGILDFCDCIGEKIHMAERNLDKLCKAVAAPENRDTVLFVLQQLRDICRHIKPKKHGIYVKAGFKDPSLTGEAVGAYSVVNSILSLNFILEPDFDREVLEIKAFMKGRIRVINLLITGIRLYGNKTLRKLIRRK